MIHSVLCGDCLGLIDHGLLGLGEAACALFDPPGELEFMGLDWDSLGGGEVFRDWLAARVTACRPLVRLGGWWCAWAHPKTGDWTAQALRRAGLSIAGEVVQLVAEGRPGPGGLLAPGHERWILAWDPGGPRAPLHLDEWQPLDARRPRTAWIASGYARGLDAIVGVRKSGAYSGKRKPDAGSRSTYGDFGGTDAGVGRGSSAGGISRYFAVGPGDELPPLLLVGPKARHRHRDMGAGERSTHPTGKAPATVAPLVALLSRPGEVVLDITAGEGGVAHAVAALGRRAVACERSRLWAPGLARRLERVGGACEFVVGEGAVD